MVGRLLLAYLRWLLGFSWVIMAVAMLVVRLIMLVAMLGRLYQLSYFVVNNCSETATGKGYNGGSQSG